MVSRNRNVRIVIEALDGAIEGLVKKVVLDIVANLVSSSDTGYGTPVDTGWARANWVPRIGTPPKGTSGSPESVSVAAQSLGIAQVAGGYRLAAGPVFISNNVPYIVFLNEGSSQQAPAGFVQNAVMKAITEDLRRGLPGGLR